MSIGILGNKVGMTQIFDEKGNAIPVTIIKSRPCYITQVKYESICGYNAVQVGYLEAAIHKKETSKPMLGHFAKANLPAFCHLKEYKIKDISLYTAGQKVSLEPFKVGVSIAVSGTTIGKGNAGNIKRNGFSRGPMSHGSKHHRLQGSIGAGTTPGRVIPGKKMSGRMGREQRTIQGLTLMYFDEEANILAVKGSVPGKCGNLLSLKVKI